MADAELRARTKRRLGSTLVGLLPAVKAREPDATPEELVPVVAWAPPWGDGVHEPAVLALHQAGARLWRADGHDPPRLEAELERGWFFHVAAGQLALLQDDTVLMLDVLDPAFDPWARDRPRGHRVAAALERALGRTPQVTPLVTIDRVGQGSPDEARYAGSTVTLLAVAVAVVAALVGFELCERLRLDLVVGPRVSLGVGVLLAAAFTTWLSRPRGRRARDGWVGLYPDRIVHVQDRLVVVPWSAARRYGDRHAGWVEVEVEGHAPLAIPTADEATRAAVLATLEGQGLSRRV